MTKIKIPNFDAINSNQPIEPQTTKVSLKQNDPPTNDTSQDPPAPQDPPTPQDPKVTIEPEIKEVIKEVVPDNLKPLHDFMTETGGTLNDYIKLNTNYDSMSDNDVLNEYYKKSKAHLDDQDRKLLLDKFKYDDLDEDDVIANKKLALKEELNVAKDYLTKGKDKYYQDLVASKPKFELSEEQQQAVDFFNRYRENESTSRNMVEDFQSRTDQYFTNDFKGFEFKLGESAVQYELPNPSDVSANQKDLSNFINKFKNEEGKIQDMAGYHKALYAAMNADKLASHFYEQGKADAIRQTFKSTNNIDNTPRQVAGNDIFIDGIKVKAVNGSDSSKLKIRKR